MDENLILYQMLESDSEFEDSDRIERRKSSKNSKSKFEECKFCNEMISYTSLAKHIKVKHPESVKDEVSSCNICGLKFFQKKSYEKHMLTKHADGKMEKFECSLCNKIFKTQAYLQNHMRTHDLSVNCKICNAELKRDSVKRHMDSCHSNNIKFQCLECSKIFKAHRYLREHKKIHSKSFECQLCEKKFPSQARVNEHVRSHHESSYDFDCIYCEKKFKTESELKTHQKIHNKNRPKPYKCLRCDYATDKKSDITKHEIFHQRKKEKFESMENPFKCDICSTLCKTKMSLNNHFRYVHSNKMYQCDVCGLNMKLLRSLKRHMKNIHLK